MRKKLYTTLLVALMPLMAQDSTKYDRSVEREIYIQKRIVEATVNLYLSQNLTLNGNDFSFVAGDFFTGKKRRKPMLGYDRDGQMTFSQTDPLFFNLLGIEYKVSVGQ